MPGRSLSTRTCGLAAAALAAGSRANASARESAARVIPLNLAPLARVEKPASGVPRILSRFSAHSQRTRRVVQVRVGARAGREQLAEDTAGGEAVEVAAAVVAAG